MNPEKDALRLNAWIMDTAIRGKSDDTLHPLLIDWENNGHFLVVYISSLDNDVTWHRIFKHTDKAFYERDYVLHPSYRDEKYKCLYDSMEDRNNRALLHCAKGAWIDDLMTTFEEKNC